MKERDTILDTYLISLTLKYMTYKYSNMFEIFTQSRTCFENQSYPNISVLLGVGLPLFEIVHFLLELPKQILFIWVIELQIFSHKIYLPLSLPSKVTSIPLLFLISRTRQYLVSTKQLGVLGKAHVLIISKKIYKAILREFSENFRTLENSCIFNFVTKIGEKSENRMIFKTRM